MSVAKPKTRKTIPRILRRKKAYKMCLLVKFYDYTDQKYRFIHINVMNEFMPFDSPDEKWLNELNDNHESQSDKNEAKIEQQHETTNAAKIRTKWIWS